MCQSQEYCQPGESRSPCSQAGHSLQLPCSSKPAWRERSTSDYVAGIRASHGLLRAPLAYRTSWGLFPETPPLLLPLSRDLVGWLDRLMNHLGCPGWTECRSWGVARRMERQGMDGWVGGTDGGRSGWMQGGCREFLSPSHPLPFPLISLLQISSQQWQQREGHQHHQIPPCSPCPSAPQNN